MKKLIAFAFMFGVLACNQDVFSAARADESYKRIMIGCGRVMPKDQGFIPEHWTNLADGDFGVDLNPDMQPHCVGDCWDLETVRTFPKNVKEISFEHVGLGGMPINWCEYLKDVVIQGPELARPTLAKNNFSRPTQNMGLSFLKSPEETFGGDDLTPCLKNYYDCLQASGTLSYMSQRSFPLFFRFSLSFDADITEEQFERFSNYMNEKTPGYMNEKTPGYHDRWGFKRDPFSIEDKQYRALMTQGLFNDGPMPKKPSLQKPLPVVEKIDSKTIIIDGLFRNVLRDGHKKLLEDSGFTNVRVHFPTWRETFGPYVGPYDSQVLKMWAKKSA